MEFNRVAHAALTWNAVPGRLPIPLGASEGCTSLRGARYSRDEPSPQPLCAARGASVSRPSLVGGRWLMSSGKSIKPKINYELESTALSDIPNFSGKAVRTSRWVWVSLICVQKLQFKCGLDESSNPPSTHHPSSPFLAPKRHWHRHTDSSARQGGDSCSGFWRQQLESFSITTLHLSPVKKMDPNAQQQQVLVCRGVCCFVSFLFSFTPRSSRRTLPREASRQHRPRIQQRRSMWRSSRGSMCSSQWRALFCHFACECFFPPRRHRGSAQPCHACPGRRPVSNPYPALLQAQYPMVGMQPGMMVMPQQQMMVTRVPARPIRTGTQA